MRPTSLLLSLNWMGIWVLPGLAKIITRIVMERIKEYLIIRASWFPLGILLPRQHQHHSDRFGTVYEV